MDDGYTHAAEPFNEDNLDRDMQEERDVAMIPFRENGKQVAPKQWDVDFLVAYVGEHGCAVEQDNLGQICMYPDLYEAPDGTLWKLEK